MNYKVSAGLPARLVHFRGILNNITFQSVHMSVISMSDYGVCCELLSYFVLNLLGCRTSVSARVGPIDQA